MSLPKNDSLPDTWVESMKHDPAELLAIRDLVEEVLLQDSSFKFGGSAGVGVNGADLDMIIDGKRYNINIEPRGE